MDSNSDGKVILSTHRLSKSFGGLLAVNSVDLEVREGELRALIGPNGAGKSTFFNMITGIDSPTSGKIFLYGEEITGLPSYKISQKGIGRTMQITSIFPGLAVYDNIWAAVQSRRKFHNPFRPAERLIDVRGKTLSIIQELGLEDKKEVLAAELSYGDQRLLEIGLALGTEPKLLLLDEPTAGLGPGETQTLTEKIKKISSRLTIILVEHDMEVVMDLADRIAVLYDGAKLAEGTPKEIMDNDEVNRVYLGGTV